MAQKKTTNSTLSTSWADRVKVSNSTTQAKIISFPRKEIDTILEISDNTIDESKLGTAAWWDFSQVLRCSTMRPILLHSGYRRIVTLRVS